MKADLIKSRIEALRNKMREKGVTAYLINTADFHNSEYVSDYFKVREYFSGFTGSAGTLLVFQDKALLWVDGRYFVQADIETEGTEIVKMHMDTDGVPTIYEYIERELKRDEVLGFDGRTLRTSDGKRLKRIAKKTGFLLKYNKCLSDGIFDRPAFPVSASEVLPEELTGLSTKKKLEKVRKELEKEGAEALFISKLDDIMWLFNIRGSDVEYNPVLMSFALITMDEAALFLQEGAVSRDLIAAAEEGGFIIGEYFSVFDSLMKGAAAKNNRNRAHSGNNGEDIPGFGEAKALLKSFISKGGRKEVFRPALDAAPQESMDEKPVPAGFASKAQEAIGHKEAADSRKSASTRFEAGTSEEEPAVMLDLNETSYSIYKAFKKHCRIIDRQNPTAKLKAVKNEVEIRNMRDIYLKDSAALTKFIFRLEKELKERDMTEVEAADLLLSFREKIPEFKGLSFSTISAYGPNAAMMHYEPSREKPVYLEKKSMLLVDSGGQYHGGTTDVTRTLVLGELTSEEKHAFTLTACSMLNLLNAVFLKGCTGRSLDILARERMWKEGLDYKCGTGHGIGYYLNVHEGPQSIRFKASEKEAVLEEGMAVTDEPGVYKTEGFGIRTENVLLVKKAFETADGQFLCFENLTLVPIDDRGIDRSEMTETELKQYIDYQKEVCRALEPCLTEEETIMQFCTSKGFLSMSQG